MFAKTFPKIFQGGSRNFQIFAEYLHYNGEPVRVSSYFKPSKRQTHPRYTPWGGTPPLR